MCGVFAQLGQGSYITGPLSLMSHRGVRYKTHEGRWGGVGHVRLPIVGLAHGYDQPMVKDRWVIGFVGEILDFRETDPGMECDSVLVEKIWHEHGPGGFRDRDGFWAIAAIDMRSGELHVLCDYLAQKPMYYRTDTRCAGSELAAVESTGPTTLDEVYLAACIKWGYCPDTRRTPYREVQHVLPGEHVVIRPDGSMNRNVVDPLERVAISDPNEIRVEIMAAVKRRTLSADVPVAALVSGGLDSSITYTLAQRHGSVRAYAVTERMSEQEQTALHDVIGERPLTNIPTVSVSTAEALEIMQEPIDLGSLKPQIVLAEAVQETVCLTGDGADEFFGGYGRAMRYDSQSSDVWQELVAWHLPRLDRVMMRQTIELRSPFLARRVAQLALGLPWESRNDGKTLLRLLFENDLPRSVVTSPKIPLRTEEVEQDRESVTAVMVDVFRDAHSRSRA